MKDLSPQSYLDLASRILADEELALDYQWNKSRQALDRPTSVDQLRLFCDLASSEMHEEHFCNKNNGASSDFGQEYFFLNPRGIVDRIIGNWIEYN
jgi:hypothetical protein